MARHSLHASPLCSLVYMQTDIYKGDFEAERRDRERMAIQLDELQRSFEVEQKERERLASGLDQLQHSDPPHELQLRKQRAVSEAEDLEQQEKPPKPRILVESLETEAEAGNQSLDHSKAEVAAVN